MVITHYLVESLFWWTGLTFSSSDWFQTIEIWMTSVEMQCLDRLVMSYCVESFLIPGKCYFSYPIYPASFTMVTLKKLLRSAIKLLRHWAAAEKSAPARMTAQTQSCFVFVFWSERKKLICHYKFWNSKFFSEKPGPKQLCQLGNLILLIGNTWWLVMYRVRDRSESHAEYWKPYYRPSSIDLITIFRIRPNFPRYECAVKKLSLPGHKSIR